MNIRTIAELPWYAAQSHPRPDQLRVKVGGRYENISSQQFFESVRATALGLHALGIRRGDRVAILSENSPFWCDAFFGAASLGAWSVPIYWNLPPPPVADILKDCTARAIFVSTQEQLDKIMSERHRLPHLQHIIIRDSPAGGESVKAMADVQAESVAIHYQQPELYQHLLAAVAPEDVLELIYTSGTTGEPKGVMLTHANWQHAMTCVTEVFGFDPSLVHLSFLPLAHIFEQGNHLGALVCGGSIAYAESLDKVPQNLLEARPTRVSTVPRMYEKIYEQVMTRANTASAVKRAMFNWAMAVGRKRAENQLDGRRSSRWLGLQTRLAHRLVYSQILARLGGRVALLGSGAAPIPHEVHMFFLSLGVPLLEIYGLTEGLAVTANMPDRIRPGTVGQALSGVEIRLAEDGEILVRSPMVMKGYYNRPEATAETLRDGWLHTGDIGQLDGEGFLKITDRKKHLIKTSGGKYVAPQAVERVLKAIPYISEAVVIGEGRPFISALIVPNFELIEQYAAGQGIAFTSREQLAGDSRIAEFLLAEIDRASSDLARFERVKKIAVLDHEFTIAAGEVTPTLKIRRHNIETRYRDLIDKLYTGAATEPAAAT
jgi:long-chain acyl-CoA synthetase